MLDHFLVGKIEFGLIVMIENVPLLGQLLFPAGQIDGEIMTG